MKSNSFQITSEKRERMTINTRKMNKQPACNVQSTYASHPRYHGPKEIIEQHKYTNVEIFLIDFFLVLILYTVLILFEIYFEFRMQVQQ